MDDEFDFLSHYVEAYIQYQLFTLTVWGFFMYYAMYRYNRLKLSIIVNFKLMFVESLMFFGFGLMALSCLMQTSTSSFNPMRAFDTGFTIGLTCLLTYWFLNDNPVYLGEPLSLFYNWKTKENHRKYFKDGYLAIVNEEMELGTNKNVSPITIDKTENSGNDTIYNFNTSINKKVELLQKCVPEKFINSTIAVLQRDNENLQQPLEAIISEIKSEASHEEKKTKKIRIKLKQEDGEDIIQKAHNQVLEVFGRKFQVNHNFVRFVDEKYIPKDSKGDIWLIDNDTKYIRPYFDETMVLAWVKGRIRVRGRCCRLKGEVKAAKNKPTKVVPSKS